MEWARCRTHFCRSCRVVSRVAISELVRRNGPSEKSFEHFKLLAVREASRATDRDDHDPVITRICGESEAHSQPLHDWGIRGAFDKQAAPIANQCVGIHVVDFAE